MNSRTYVLPFSVVLVVAHPVLGSLSDFVHVDCVADHELVSVVVVLIVVHSVHHCVHYDQDYCSHAKVVAERMLVAATKVRMWSAFSKCCSRRRWLIRYPCRFATHIRNTEDKCVSMCLQLGCWQARYVYFYWHVFIYASSRLQTIQIGKPATCWSVGLNTK